MHVQQGSDGIHLAQDARDVRGGREGADPKPTVRIRHAAATRIQNLYRGGRAWKSYISKLDALEAALGDFDQKAGRKEDRLISRAAAHLQGFCRIMQARDRMFVRVQQEYQKKYDKITGSHYYFITRTKRSVWHKPKVR